MKRRQLFEFGDQRWLPKSFRGYLRNILSYQAGVIYRYALPKLIEALQYTKTKEILDLCSGEGGPWPVLAPLLNERAPYPIQITLSDKFPSRENAYNNKNTFLSYVPSSLDILNIPDGLPRFRTLFTGFHHFPPKAAKSILAKAVEDNCAIVIFEFTEREKKNIKQMWRAPGLVFRLTRQLAQLSRGQWFWTYLVPIMPLLYAWDGMVSHWRSYTVAELKEMSAAVTVDNYQWDCGQIELPRDGRRITYLIGLPENKLVHSRSQK